jgi:adenylate kinase
VDWCDRVYEIDTTGKTVEEVSDAILKILGAIDRGIEIEGYDPGSVDWLESEATCLGHSLKIPVFSSDLLD